MCYNKRQILYANADKQNKSNPNNVLYKEGRIVELEAKNAELAYKLIIRGEREDGGT